MLFEYGLGIFCWVYWMGFTVFDKMMIIILFLVCCAFHAHSKMSQRHLLVFLRSSWFSMCLALPAYASLMHTTCSSVAHAYINAMFMYFIQTSYTLLLSWSIQHAWVISLPNYHCVLISWTNLNLIKLVFMYWCFALGSLLRVCSFADVSSFLSWKRTRD